MIAGGKLQIKDLKLTCRSEHIWHNDQCIETGRPIGDMYSNIGDQSTCFQRPVSCEMYAIRTNTYPYCTSQFQTPHGSYRTDMIQMSPLSIFDYLFTIHPLYRRDDILATDCQRRALRYSTSAGLTTTGSSTNVLFALPERPRNS